MNIHKVEVYSKDSKLLDTYHFRTHDEAMNLKRMLEKQGFRSQYYMCIDWRKDD